MEKAAKVMLVIGMLISLFLLYEHFTPSASKFCTFGSNFDCGIVNKSPYANVDGLSYLLTIDLGMNLPIIDIAGINPFFDLVSSNAFLGFLTLVFLFLLIRMKEEKMGFWFIKKNQVKYWIKGITLFGVFYGFYLFLVQHFILRTYCIFCIALDFVLITLFILTWVKMK